MLRILKPKRIGSWGKGKREGDWGLDIRGKKYFKKD